MVEISRPFDGAQGMLQAKRKSVMPAPDQSRGQAAAGIPCGGGGAKTQNLDSRPSALLRTCFRGKDGMGGRLPVDVMKSLGVEPRVV